MLLLPRSLTFSASIVAGLNRPPARSCAMSSLSFVTEPSISVCIARNAPAEGASSSGAAAEDDDDDEGDFFLLLLAVMEKNRDDGIIEVVAKRFIVVVVVVVVARVGATENWRAETWESDVWEAVLPKPGKARARRGEAKESRRADEDRDAMVDALMV